MEKKNWEKPLLTQLSIKTTENQKSINIDGPSSPAFS
jgi:hypothetical protein